MIRHALKALAAAALLVVGLAVGGAQAAPAGAGLVPLSTQAQTSSAVEKTRWVRRCYHTRRGVRCHRVWVGHRHYRPHRHYRHHRHHHRGHRHYRGHRRW